MREINVSTLTDVIERLCIEANEHLPEDVKCAPAAPRWNPKDSRGLVAPPVGRDCY